MKNKKKLTLGVIVGGLLVFNLVAGYSLKKEDSITVKNLKAMESAAAFGTCQSFSTGSCQKSDGTYIVGYMGW